MFILLILFIDKKKKVFPIFLTLINIFFNKKDIIDVNPIFTLLVDLDIKPIDFSIKPVEYE